MRNISSKLPLILLIIVSAGALFGFGCRKPQPVQETTTTSLVVWGLWQDSSILSPVLRAFKDQTGIDVQYKKIASVGSYEKELIAALAEGRGPDIFVINNTWVEGKRGLMSPASPELLSPRDVQNEFVEVVDKDLSRDGYVYALPTSVDTLALFYNKDLFNTAGIAAPPRTWTEFQSVVTKLTKVSTIGVIGQSGVALGTASNINRAPDILQMLMMQSGLPILDTTQGEKRVDIANDIGARALSFYTDFSNKSKQVFTWDITQDYSIDAFSQGKTAMLFNYAYQIPTIKAKNQRLSFAVAPAPQIDGNSKQVTFASYWPFAVSASSKSPQASWQFVRFLTSKSVADVVNKAQGVPPARRDSIPEYSTDPVMGVFAEQGLKATSWPRVDIVETDAIFNTMIDKVATTGAVIQEVLKQSQDQLQRIVNGNAN
ncbi:MAG TPA: extracellular solute-binding protein [Candidatus Andersenbacteria bacterium]|nr:extracellular solute-binding protein [Candidatus Andersenbacteria bacterium]